MMASSPLFLMALPLTKMIRWSSDFLLLPFFRLLNYTEKVLLTCSLIMQHQIICVAEMSGVSPTIAFPHNLKLTSLAHSLA